jgi:UDP-N-acetylglucosamine 3-dehydrogenase
VTEDVRIGVIGLGFGANHARVLQEIPGVCLAAVADTSRERLAPYHALGVCAYTDLEAMLATERLHAVIVAVPAGLHTEVALAAIGAGCAVLVEKPLAPSYADAKRIVAAARDAGVALMPGHIERFNPAVIELARRVQEGEIGRALQVTARRMSSMRERQHGRPTPPSDVNVVHDSAIHDIDAIRYILGLDVESVYGVGQSGIVTPHEDAITATMRFAGGSLIATLEVNWLSRRRVRDLTVLGERGTFLVDYAAKSLSLYRTPGEPPEEVPVAGPDQLEAELNAFIAAVREGAPLPVTPEDGLAAVAIADAITRSARSGKPVAMAEVWS